MLVLKYTLLLLLLFLQEDHTQNVEYEIYGPYVPTFQQNKLVVFFSAVSHSTR